MSGFHTPSDMSADELHHNERASRIEAGSWDCESELWYDRELARNAILRSYIKIVGVVECPSGHSINYGDIDFENLTLDPYLFNPIVVSLSEAPTTDDVD